MRMVYMVGVRNDAIEAIYTARGRADAYVAAMLKERPTLKPEDIEIVEVDWDDPSDLRSIMPPGSLPPTPV